MPYENKENTSAADMVKLAMLNIYRNPRFHEMKGSLYLLIHDEIIIDVPAVHANEAKDLLEEAMLKAAYTLVPTVPFVADAMIMDYWVKD